MNLRTHQIKVQRTAHFSTLGEASQSTKYFWIVCHGYGQLSKFFIRKFDVLENDNSFILAPEGLSRFYWPNPDTSRRQPVASWMTRENRLDEINDYCNMLSQLRSNFLEQCQTDTKVILLGFSQGCATQIRWIHQHMPAFDAIILWGGLPPEDLDYSAINTYWKNKPRYFVYGKQDQYLTPQVMQFYEKLVKEKQLDFTHWPFEGQHVIDRKVLKALSEELYARL